jgi:hypothetical protein
MGSSFEISTRWSRKWNSLQFGQTRLSKYLIYKNQISKRKEKILRQPHLPVSLSSLIPSWFSLRQVPPRLVRAGSVQTFAKVVFSSAISSTAPTLLSYPARCIALSNPTRCGPTSRLWVWLLRLSIMEEGLHLLKP